MSSEAKVTVAVEGGDQVKRAFEDIVSASRKVGGELDKASDSADKLGKEGKRASGFWKDAGRDITSSLQTVTTSALATVTAVNTISFAQAITSAKALDDSLARYATGGGQSISTLRKNVRELSAATLTQEKDILSWGKAVGRTTYDYKNALDTVKAFSAEAVASNQDLSEQGGLAELFSNGFQIKGADETTAFLERLRGMSEAANNAGGFDAFKDQLVGLQGTIEQLGIKTHEGAEEFAAFQLAIGKGRTPQQAAKLQQGLVASLQGHGEGLARQFGYNNVYDEQGNMKDIPTLVHKIREDLQQRYGKDAKRVASLGQNFGPQLASAIFDPTIEEAYRNNLNAKSSGAAKAAMNAYQNSDEGRRAKNDLTRNQAKEDAARSTFWIQDALGEFGANHPLLSSVGGGVLGVLGKAGVSAGAKALFGGGGAAAATAGTAEASLLTGGALANTGFLGGAGLAGAGILGSLAALTATTAPLNANMPQIRDETAAGLEGMREGRARAIVAAVERGGAGGAEGVEQALGPATLGAVKADPVLNSLLQQFENQAETIQGLPENIAKATAEALKGSPINVNVLNQAGTPIMGVAHEQANRSRQ